MRKQDKDVFNCKMMGLEFHHNNSSSKDKGNNNNNNSKDTANCHLHHFEMSAARRRQQDWLATMVYHLQTPRRFGAVIGGWVN